MAVSEPEFLNLPIILDCHAESLARYGGCDGIRDMGLIESALASAQNAYYYGRGDLFDIAAAYAFHLAQAQAFLDGNKRTAAGAALNFLAGNGYVGIRDGGSLYDAIIAIAEKRMDKAGLAGVFRRLSLPKKDCEPK